MTTTPDTLAKLAAHWNIQCVDDDHVLVVADGLASATVSIKSHSPVETLLAALAMDILDGDVLTAQALPAAEPVAFIQKSAHESELVWSKDEELEGLIYDYEPLYATPQAAQQAAQATAGWVLVPVEPTKEMIEAVDRIRHGRVLSHTLIYAAIAARPTALPQPQPQSAQSKGDAQWPT